MRYEAFIHKGKSGATLKFLKSACKNRYILKLITKH